MKQSIVGIITLGIVCLAMLFAGCAKDNTAGPGSASPNVAMKVSFSTATSVTLGKTDGTLGVDSLRIDSAVVVFSRIKFEQHIDTVVADTSEGAPDDDHDMNVTFRGPFVVHVRDTVAIDFANQQLPAGTYDGIKFKIHALRNHEQHEDSDERNHEHMESQNDSSITGSCITVWGAIKKNGVWTAFTFKFDGEVEFKLKGNFTIPATTSTVNLALNFNMGAWFVDPQTHALLDPTDTTMMNRMLIRHAIYASFGKGRGGHDRGDGKPE